MSSTLALHEQNNFLFTPKPRDGALTVARATPSPLSLTTFTLSSFFFLSPQVHAGPGVGTGKDFTLFALRDGEVLFKPGAKGKNTVRVVDRVEKGGREDGKPSRKDKRRELYTPRAQQREAAAAATR